MCGVPFPDGWNAKTSGSTVPPYGFQKQSTTALKSQPCSLFFHPCMKHLRIRSALMKSQHCLTSCINHAGIRFPVIMRSKQYGSKLSVAKIHIYDDQLNYICSHNLSERKGSVNQLPEHRKQDSGDWIEIMERLRGKWTVERCVV